MLGHPVKLTALAGDGGDRLYFRLEGEKLVLLYGPNSIENMAWLRIGRHLWFKGLPVPRIHHYHLGQGWFILDDLGDRHLAYEPDSSDGYFLAAKLLAKLHQDGLDGFNPAWSHQSRGYSFSQIRDLEINYFRREVLTNYLGWTIISKHFTRETGALARLAASHPSAPVLMHRDFQGRNLMLAHGSLWAIDWQGARPGPAAYDLVSLTEETPSNPLTPAFKKSLLEYYCQQRGPGPWRKTIRPELVILSGPRLMQALGAYAKLTLAGKSGYEAFMAPVARRLAEIFCHPLLKSFGAMRETTTEAARQLAQKTKESLETIKSSQE